MSNQMMSEKENSSHLAGITDGAGCTEVWEHLSQYRDAAEHSEHDSD